MAQPPQIAQVKLDSFIFAGGLDLVTPTLSLKPGAVRNSINFECAVAGGYARIEGYERVDGHARPSGDEFKLFQAGNMQPSLVLGANVVGVTSAATGVICFVGADCVCLTKITGTFTNEVINISAVAAASITANSVTSFTPRQYAETANNAADVYRSLISPPPGSGPCRGVAVLNDIIYAWRDNAGGTAVDIHKSSASGWVDVPLPYTVTFTVGGTVMPAEGTTLTQGGVTATVRRICHQAGAWSGTSASGRIIISAPAGGNFAAGAATIGAITLTLAGAQTQIAIAVGGKYEFIKDNFYGGSSTIRLYGCDGVNKAFEFDGTYYVPIVTSSSPDTPKHIESAQDGLCLSFLSSLVISSPGNPFNYDAVINFPQEWPLGSNITGLVRLTGNQSTSALAVFTREDTYILYGTTESDSSMKTYNTGSGAIDYSVQNMSQTLAFDDKGVNSIQTSLSYGNFAQNTLTYNIYPLIERKRSLVSCSCVDRKKSQYRIYFSDGYGIYITLLNGKFVGSMPVALAMKPFCIWSGKLANGDDAIFVGGEDGYVYQMDKGTSFDGEPIPYFLQFNYSGAGNARLLKKYKSLTMEINGSSYVEMQVGYYLGYADASKSQPNASEYDKILGSSYWDNFFWDNFFWDSQGISPLHVELSGSAENIALVVRGESDLFKSFTLSSGIVHYSPRRLKRS